MLNSITAVFQHWEFWYWMIHKGWYAIKQRNQPNNISFFFFYLYFLLLFFSFFFFSFFLFNQVNFSFFPTDSLFAFFFLMHFSSSFFSFSSLTITFSTSVFLSSISFFFFVLFLLSWYNQWECFSLAYVNVWNHPQTEGFVGSAVGVDPVIIRPSPLSLYISSQRIFKHLLLSIAISTLKDSCPLFHILF